VSRGQTDEMRQQGVLIMRRSKRAIHQGFESEANGSQMSVKEKNRETEKEKKQNKGGAGARIWVVVREATIMRGEGGREGTNKQVV